MDQMTMCTAKSTNYSDERTELSFNSAVLLSSAAHFRLIVMVFLPATLMF